jgi:hypothetical protein
LRAALHSTELRAGFDCAVHTFVLSARCARSKDETPFDIGAERLLRKRLAQDKLREGVEWKLYPAAKAA